MKEANLLITYNPSHVVKAREEIRALLGSETVEFLDSDTGGLFLLITKKDPKLLTKELRDTVEENPEKCRYTFHWIPIEKWCKSDISDISREMKKMNERMSDSDSWKLDLGRRPHDPKQRTSSLVMQLTQNIDRPKVDLKNPQKIVKVEIIGDRAGIALLDSSELLDIPRIKMNV